MSKRNSLGASHANVDWLIGGGEMGKLIRSKDWSQTPLGPIEHWPQSLRTTVSLCLASNFPISLAWGPQLTQIYNDGYWPICGGKHPHSMGQDFSACWASAWPVIGDAFAQALAGQASYLENRRMFLDRNGYLEETFFTFSFSPIRDESGGVGGLFHPVTETTSRMLSERRTRVLRDLSGRAGKAHSIEEAFAITVETLADYDLDLPFVLIYRLDDDKQQARLIEATGLKASDAAAPPIVDINADSRTTWPLMDVVKTGSAVQVDNLVQRMGRFSCGPYSESPSTAVLLPITPPGWESPLAVLVAGVSARLRLNEMYLSFYDLLASAVTTAVANAGAYEEERKRAEALAELDRAKTTFFSNVSHEFRTPLTLMLGPVEDSLSDTEEPLGPKHRERLEVAHRNSLRLQKLVNTLLDFSRIEAGRVQASYEPTDLASFTCELASTFRSACEKAGLKLTLDCDPLDEPVYVDRDMWEKIVLNLLSNAFKYTLDGGIEVRQRVIEGNVEMAVRDTGVGISSEELPKLFERFHRIEGARGRTQEGSGIGLALVRELVRLHQGDVHVESTPGAGSVFRVSIPLGKRHLPADRIEAARELASTALGVAPFVEEALRWLPCTPTSDRPSDVPSSSPLTARNRTVVEQAKRFRILLADDNADMCSYVCRLLSDQYDVIEVADGESALVAARTQKPDLILSDIMMPKMDGFALLKELRSGALTREIPVIFLSARAGEEARVEGMKAGADDYLTKPFSAKELLVRVHTHLSLAALRREAAETLRESEARFRNMADNAPVIIWVTDSTGFCTYLNQQWYEFTGATETQGLGFDWLDWVHPDERPVSEQVFKTANERREAFRLEYRLRRHDGQYRWSIDSAAPRFGADGEFLGYIGSVIDIADLKLVESQLREADRRKDEFLATLAHELRNPLAPIRTGLEVMRLAKNDPDVIEEIRETMERQTLQMVRLIDDLMDVSRITRGKFELRRCRVELAEVVQSAVEATRHLIDQARHQLTITLPEQATFLDADPHRFAQIISNLLNNAAKYTPEGGKISLTAVRQKADLRLSVRDSGLGVPEEQLDEIFEMFTQIDRRMEKGYTGLGIGLTLVKSLVEMHGGSVEVHSEGPNQGSEFTVRVPILLETPGDPQSHGADEPIAQTKRRLLVVDDNRAAANALSVMLTMLGHEVHTAYDGLQALEMGKEIQPDAVLLDLGMPKLNGFDTARRMRKEPWGKEAVLVAVTGWGQGNHKRRTKEAGFDHHLVKPAEPSDLQRLFAQP